MERTLVILKPDVVERSEIGIVLFSLESDGLHIIQLHMRTLSAADVEFLYAEHVGKDFFARNLQFMTRGHVVLVEVLGDQATQRCREIAGPTDPEVSRKKDPETIRARFGTKLPKNAVHCSADEASARRELEYFFPGTRRAKPNEEQIDLFST